MHCGFCKQNFECKRVRGFAFTKLMLLMLQYCGCYKKNLERGRVRGFAFTKLMRFMLQYADGFAFEVLHFQNTRTF